MNSVKSYNKYYRTWLKGRRVMSFPYLGGSRFLGCLACTLLLALLVVDVSLLVLNVASSGYHKSISLSTLSPCTASVNFKKVLEAV